MQRSSPFASAGLIRFDASITPPEAAPAPITVWISSMNRIAPGCFLSSPTHALEALLEVAAVLGARDQRAHVERVDRAVARARRAPCLRRSGAPGPRRSRSCRRRPRRRTAGCSCGGGTGSRSCARPRAGGRSAGRCARRCASSLRLVVYFSSAPSRPRLALAFGRRRRPRARPRAPRRDFDRPCEM